ncbi:T9SS type A sorting domain-containing protein, partial [Candidatus Poribacteria bacterium]|nr:T9SS type A sorting domain-containing protein [Candidatus Poribacteria bacterium]
LDDNQQISDLSPLAGLINLEVLSFDSPNVSDLSPLSRLTKLEWLHFTDTNVSNFSPLAGLINLKSLGFNRTHNISDISPLAGLVNLKFVSSWGHNISDLSPLAGLTKLEVINFCGGNISNIKGLSRLTNLKELYLAREEVSDISVLANLTGLTRLDLHNNPISDISPIKNLTQLKWLELRATNTSDISILARFTNLEWLNISENNISDISPIANLTNLKWLSIAANNITDFSPLDNIRENLNTLHSYANPASPKGGPKIEGPWLWVTFPSPAADEMRNGVDLIAKASNGRITQTEVATNGAAEGNSIGTETWTYHKLPTSGYDNIEDMLKQEIPNGIIYGTISLNSPQQQQTTMYVGGERDFKVWLNGELVFEDQRGLRAVRDVYTDSFPTTLKQGRNILLVAIHTNGNGFFGFEPGTEYTIANPGIQYNLSTTPIFVGDTFTISIDTQNMFDMAGWQFDIHFDPTALQIITINEGNLLKQNATTMFLSGSTNNTAGKITGLRSVRLSPQGITGTGTILQIECKAKSAGETELTLNNVQFATITGDTIPAGPHKTTITIEGELATGDVNRDGNVDTQDLILIAQQLGNRVPPNSPTDVNGDGIINTTDLLLVQQEIDAAAAAPPRRHVDTAMIEAWIAKAQLEDDGSLVFKQGIENLKALLIMLKPESTKLLANYPNPFNPETWIPYQLAQSAEVTLTIYDMNGKMVRRLAVGHKVGGVYQSRSRAAYWDGRNHLGEAVASGLYFYTLTAGEFTGTRRMLILK